MKIRKDNDFVLNWAINWNGVAEDFTGVTDIVITASIFGSVKTIPDTSYSIIGNIVRIEFTPEICNINGVYRLELKYSKQSPEFVDGERRSAVDVRAFQIVETSDQADATQDVSVTSDAVAGFALKYEDLTAEQKDELRGKGITSIELSTQDGDTKTYTITYADGETFDFDVIDGHSPIFTFSGTVLLIDGVPQVDLKGETGNGIDSIELTSTVGLVKTYTITFTDATTKTFTVTDGAAAVVQEKGSNTSVVMSQKAVTDELVQLSGELNQTDAKITIGKNLLPPIVEAGKYISGVGTIIANPGSPTSCTTPLRLKPNTIYALSGNAFTLSSGLPRVSLSLYSDSTSVQLASLTEVFGGYIFTTGDDNLWFRVNLRATTIEGDIIDGVVQLEEGNAPTSYETYSEKLSADEKNNNELQAEIEALEEEIPTNIAEQLSLKFVLGKNLLPPLVEAGKYISGVVTIIANPGSLTACTMPVMLKANTTYALSGASALNTTARRAILMPLASSTSGQLVTLTEVVGGFTFTTGSENLWFRTNVKVTTVDGSVIDGTIQLEEGNTPTSYVPYSEKLSADEKSNNELQAEIEALGSTARYTIFNLPPANNFMHKKLPLFFDHYLKRDIDINVVLVGDSIFARDFHTTYYSEEEQTKRPPLLTSKNIASKIWDKIEWQNTEYARYDRSGIFTETGAFATVLTNPNNTVNNGINSTQWDDFNRRPGHTRMFSGAGAASTQFAIAENVYKFNFIYRTDLNGSQTNSVTVAEGNGKVQVYDLDTQTWIEANGYVFSMRHGAVETHRGNTKYQERLKFRTCDLYDGGSFDQRAGSKIITITKTDSTDTRFMYWGIEYSKEAYMMKLINSARGGLGISSMLPFFDDDVYDWTDEENTFTLIIHEIYLNQGSNQFDSNKTIPEFIAEWNTYAYSESNAYSIRERSKSGVTPWQNFEMMEWSPVGSAESGGILLTEPYGWAIQTNINPPKTIYDNFLSYLRDYKDNYDETGLAFVNMTTIMWREAQVKFGKQWYQAYQASGITGESFLNDVTHPNDYGCSVIAAWINAALDFYYF